MQTLLKLVEFALEKDQKFEKRIFLQLKEKSIKIMAEESDPVMAEVMSL